MYTLPNSLPYVDLLPGPFILLFLIPLLPLTLFSLGARPPGPASFPLSDELWRTTALLGSAVAIAIGVGMYPDSMGDLVSWVKDGRMRAGVMKVGIGGGNWMGWGQVWNQAQAGSGVGVGIGGKRMMTRDMARRIAKSRKPSFERIAANHIAAIRYYHPKLYNASSPRLSSVVGLGLIISIVVIITWGKVLSAIYESDKTPQSRLSSSSSDPLSKGNSKGPSEWVKREYELRKKETKETTKERFKVQEKELAEKYKLKKKAMESEKKSEEYTKYILKKSDERRKDVVDLKKMLEVKKIEWVGLDKDPGWIVKGSENVKKDNGDDKEEGEAVKRDEGTKEGAKVTLTLGDKVRKALMGNLMATSLKRDKSKSMSMSKTPPARAPGPEVVVVQPVAARGPGWEVADTPAAGVALAKSAGAAEALARGMGK